MHLTTHNISFIQFLLLSEGIRREKLFIICLKIECGHYTNLFDSILVLQTYTLFCIIIAFFSNYVYKKRKPCITTFNAMTSLNIFIILAWSSYRLRLHINLKKINSYKRISFKRTSCISTFITTAFRTFFTIVAWSICMFTCYIATWRTRTRTRFSIISGGAC